ncbi:MAG: hypothetical protein H6919_11335 [Sphingomonadaceae bacterium]|nr:hypothetical protein [Sphingomonadaceae bacterium]MCP5383545.1 hypothetical protein [Altererythrobacter sp.]MCP5394487.1 hypothetical protein [Sphingomonadaceae bacterium]
MFFVPYGPFDIREVVESENRFRKKDFWETVEARPDYKGLSWANGLYIFSIKFGSNFKPWYVGKTCSRYGFSQEVFQPHKIRHYRKVCKKNRGSPHLHLIAKVEGQRGNFCRASGRSDKQIDAVESYLIGMALAHNPKLRNNKKTSFFKYLDIEGVIGPKYDGRPRDDARTLKNVLGIQL